MGLPLSITLAQISPTVGDIASNAALIQQHWLNCESDLIVFPEMCLTGYPADDLWLEPAFIAAAKDSLSDLVACSKSTNSAALIPAPYIVDNMLHNCAILLHKGRMELRSKYALPNEGVFDEKRYFTAGPLPAPITLNGVSLGVMVCEDMWSHDVATHLNHEGAEILIIPNASPFSASKHDQRMLHAKARVAETGLPLVYVNQVGGHDDVVFDGGSFALDSSGDIAAQLPWFESHIYHLDRSASGVERSLDYARDDHETLYKAMVLGTRDYVRKSGFRSVLLGLSGGVDSALVACIAVEALGAENVRAYMLPSDYTSRDSREDAESLARKLGIKISTVPISPAVGAIDRMIRPKDDITQQNIQSRIRGLTLMALSNEHGAMLLTTGNKSEMAAGYATLYGDMNGAYNPIKDLYKTQVYAVCDWLNRDTELIPRRILTKAPTAELKPDQTDQDNLPPYDVLDDILMHLIEKLTPLSDIPHDALTVAQVAQMLQRTEYKRYQAPPGPKLTDKAFDRDRRYPLVNGRQHR